MRGEEREVISLDAIPDIQRDDRVSDLVGEGLDPPVSPCEIFYILGGILGHIAYCPNIYTIELSRHTQFNTNHS